MNQLKKIKQLTYLLNCVNDITIGVLLITASYLVS